MAKLLTKEKRENWGKEWADFPSTPDTYEEDFPVLKKLFFKLLSHADAADAIIAKLRGWINANVPAPEDVPGMEESSDG